MEGFRYRVIILPEAEKDILAHKKAGNKVALTRIKRILEELAVHPETGIGKPEKLKYGYSGQWSREIDKKNRMRYEIKETEITVDVISVISHYGDK